MTEQIANIILISSETFISFIVSIILSMILCFSIALVYRHTHKGLNYESSFLSTLATLGPIVTLVMFFIQGDLVLSLGLVGSLSIIRFRTPIKDTRDMVFLFWTIAIGLGVGTLNWTLSILATIILSIIIILFFIIRYGAKVHAEYILIIGGQMPFEHENIAEMLISENIRVQLRSHETKGDHWEVVYELRFKQMFDASVRNMIKDIQAQSGVEHVSLLSPQLALPL